MAAWLLLPAPARAAGEAEAAKVVESMANTVLKILADKSASRQAREQLFAEILNKNFDVPTIARFTLGRAWNDASPAQRDGYLAVFRQYIVKTYVVQLSQYSGEQFKVTKTEADGEGAVVHTMVSSPSGGNPVDIKWRMRMTGGAMKVRDVVIQNISMSLTQRNEFASVMQQRNNSVDGLIQALKDKVAELDRK
ncbi:MAG: phospholipid-binding protein MlaC [Alphaproteobacteria bacterium]